jgi:peroxiredoxin
MQALKAGPKAPEFTLPSTPDQKVLLSEIRGNPVVLVFYPADWSPVCGDQLALYNELRQEFANLNASLIAISADGIWCHLALAEGRKYHFTLVSDFEPKGATSANRKKKVTCIVVAGKEHDATLTTVGGHNCA